MCLTWLIEVRVIRLNDMANFISHQCVKCRTGDSLLEIPLGILVTSFMSKHNKSQYQIKQRMATLPKCSNSRQHPPLRSGNEGKHLAHEMCLDSRIQIY